ncbi:MAG: helix-turn-helix domain-containing protein [Defluviitaleaceae bacterium]|nr:helix-turn-helix domain-containing protein [Defluviitaleaceae bacterium]
MGTQETVAFRIRQLCKEKGFTPHGISVYAAVPHATVKSILHGESKNPGIVTIKKLCDGFGITLAQFFDTPEFNGLEQEIK